MCLWVCPLPLDSEVPQDQLCGQWCERRNGYWSDTALLEASSTQQKLFSPPGLASKAISSTWEILGDLAEHLSRIVKVYLPLQSLELGGRHRSHNDSLVSTLESVTKEPSLEASSPPSLY